MNRDELITEYFRLTREVLPERGRAEKWVVTNDHCFQRIVLDHLCGGPWRNTLTARLPAYRQLTEAQLVQGVALARYIDAEGDVLLREMNRQSLQWRGKQQARDRD